MEENELLEEFTLEALELIEDAENGLLQINKGADFSEQYNLIFRSFHSLKGASGMMGVDLLQHYVHELETNFSTKKDDDSLSKELLDYFLQGIDQMRDFLNGDTHELSIDELEYPDEKTTDLKNNTDRPSHVNTLLKEEKDINPDFNLGKIYIIDDEPDIIELLEEVLSEQSLKIEVFVDVDDLITTIENTEDLPNLIISDFNMPKKNGEELLNYIHENVDNIPFLYISGYLDKKIVMRLLDKGAIGFIDKPFDEEDLIRKIKKALIRTKSLKLIDATVDALIGNFGELEACMKKNGKEELLNLLRTQMSQILDQKKVLNKLLNNKL